MDHLSIQSLADAFAKKDAEIEQLKTLITELCDALNSCNPGWPEYHKDIIARAQKATDGR